MPSSEGNAAAMKKKTRKSNNRAVSQVIAALKNSNCSEGPTMTDIIKFISSSVAHPVTKRQVILCLIIHLKIFHQEVKLVGELFLSWLLGKTYSFLKILDFFYQNLYFSKLIDASLLILLRLFIKKIIARVFRNWWLIFFLGYHCSKARRGVRYPET